MPARSFSTDSGIVSRLPKDSQLVLQKTARAHELFLVKLVSPLARHVRYVLSIIERSSFRLNKNVSLGHMLRSLFLDLALARGLLFLAEGIFAVLSNSCLRRPVFSSCFYWDIRYWPARAHENVPGKSGSKVNNHYGTRGKRAFFYRVLSFRM